MTQTQKVAIGIYGAILVCCVVLMLVSDSVGPSRGQGIFDLASEGFKTALAALIGAGSILMGGKNG